MCKDDWFSAVLDDLKDFCETYGLESTKPLLELAKRTFESERMASEPSELTIEDWLARENQPLH